MNIGDRKKRRFFTAADVLIAVVVLALAAGAVVLLLFPREEKTTASPVEVTMLIHLREEGELDGIAKGDRLFRGGSAIGSVSHIDKSSNNVVIAAEIEKDDGAYLLFGEPVRVNGVFVLETRLRRVEGVVESIDEKGTAGDE